MWRLFPKSWFSAQPRGVATATIEAAANHFHDKWHALLVAGLSEVLSRTDISEETAIQLLPSLDGEDLSSLDWVIRLRWRYQLPVVSPARPPMTTPIGDPEGSAYLFMASCHGNGFIRERALIAFHHYPGRLALIAALIRCDDWVPPVQQAASVLLGKLLDWDSAELIFDELTLITRLRQRQRIGHQVWPEQIEPALRASRFREQRWRSTDAVNPEARALAYELVLHADSDRAEEALRKACAGVHPRVALWGQKNLGLLTELVQCDVLRDALRHPHAAVRTAALRQYASMAPTGLQEDLEAAIFDRSRGPRDAAAYFLDQQFQVSARAMWREVIDSPDPVRLPVAFAALSSAAEFEDVDRMAPFLSDSSARIRAMALRGVVRAKASQAEGYLLSALLDTSGLVVRSALSLLSKEGQLLSREDLERAYIAAQNDQVRRQLIRGSRLLEKWDELLFLLPLLSGQDAMTAGEGIDRWLLRANRRFTSLDDATKATIAAHLAEVPGEQRDRRWRSLDQLLRQS